MRDQARAQFLARALDAGADPRTGIRAVFSWSYQHLDPVGGRCLAAGQGAMRPLVVVDGGELAEQGLQLGHGGGLTGLDGNLDELEARIPALPGKQRAQAAEWLARARQYRHSIDPLCGPLAMPQIRRPSPADLEPFLHGWSPYGPGA